MQKADISSMTYDALKEYVLSLGIKAFRTDQIFSWLHKYHVSSFEQMTNLPASLRKQLDECSFITTLSTAAVQCSKDGTKKFLLELPDHNKVEAVRMQYNHGPSFCISTQVGCAMGCSFCASTIGGLVKNLTAGEILGEIYELSRSTDAPDSIVLMGIGEPLDNFDNLMDFLDILSDPRGDGMSLRHVSLSTCGLCDRIDELADKKLGLTLSVSLHACDDEKRSRIMPVNRRYDLKRLMDSCKRYFEITGRRISYEYALIEGENDSIEDADRLAALLRGQNCHVNLIPANHVEGRPYRKSRSEAVKAFESELAAKGINATVRRELGSDIDAACGQLRRAAEGL